MSKIIVKPVDNRISPQKRHLATNIQYQGNGRWVNTGVPSKKNKAGDSNDIYKFCRKGLFYQTGLMEYTENIFKDSSSSDVKIKYNLSPMWDVYLENVVKQDKISFQVLYEIFFGLQPGELKSDFRDTLRTVIGTKNPATAIEGFAYTLYDGANVIETSLYNSQGERNTLRMLLASHLVKNHPKIATDKSKYNPNEHNFYIAEQYEEEQEALKRDEMENDAIASFTLFSRSTTFANLYKFSVLLTDADNKSIVKGESTETAVKAAVNRYIKNVSKEQKQNIDKLNAVLKIYESDKERFNVEYLCRAAINSGLIYASNGLIYWKSKIEDPAWYNFRTYDSFVNAIFEEFGKHNPKKPTDNRYLELLAEVKNKQLIV